MTFIWLLNISHGKVLVLWPWTSYYEINLGCALRGYIGYDNFTLFLYYYNYYAWWSHISKKKQLNIIEQSRRVPCTLEISYTIGCVKTHPIIYNCYIIVNHIACGGEESRVNSPFLALGLVCQLHYLLRYMGCTLCAVYWNSSGFALGIPYNMYLSPEVGARPLISHLHMVTNDVHQHNKNNYKFIASTLAALFITIIIIMYMFSMHCDTSLLISGP